MGDQTFAELGREIRGCKGEDGGRGGRMGAGGSEVGGPWAGSREDGGGFGGEGDQRCEKRGLSLVGGPGYGGGASRDPPGGPAGGDLQSPTQAPSG